MEDVDSKTLQNKINKVYQENEFFDFDEDSGELKQAEGLKFETKPFIGRKYCETDCRILFVGKDVGKPEGESDQKSEMQSFSQRRATVIERINQTITTYDDDKTQYDYDGKPRDLKDNRNRHIPGTFVTATKILIKEIDKDWSDTWKEWVEGEEIGFRKALQESVPDENPLDHVALTNLYKFVELDDNNTRRSGSEIEKFREKQFNLLCREISILDPDVIVFQGKYFEPLIIPSEMLDGKTVYVGPHPSAPGTKISRNFLENIYRKIPPDNQL